MSDHEIAIFEVWVWFLLVFATIMLIPWFWRRITTQSDAIADADAAIADADAAIADADAAKAEADLIIDEFESIESYLDDWAPGLSTKVAIAETRAFDQDRA